jgi:transcriptional regulator with XRE-family HTH domain
MYIGTQLRKLRDKRKLSQQQVADHLGVAQSTYWNWESDESHFRVEYLPKLAEILQIDANELLPEGSMVKIVNNNDNKDNSVNAFAVKMDGRMLLEKLLTSLENQLALMEEKNKVLTEKNTLLTEENALLKESVSRK